MADMRIEQATRLASDLMRFRTFEIEIVQEAIVRPKIPYNVAKPMKSNIYKYIETKQNHQFLDSSMKGLSDEVIQHTTFYGDGTKYWTVEYQSDRPDIQQRITIGSSFAFEVSQGGTKRPHPINWLYVDKIPLAEALPTSKYLGEVQIEGRSCHRFLFENVLYGNAPQTLVYSLADDTVFPVNVVSFRDESAMSANRPSWIWETTEGSRIQGRNVPVKSRLALFDREKPTQEYYVDNIIIKNLEFDKTYDASAFTPVIGPDADVYDSTSAQLTLSKKAQNLPAVVMIDPVRVPPTTDGSSWVVACWVGLGILAISVGVILKRKQS